MRTYVKKLKEKLEEEVLVKGWVHKINNLGNIAFVLLRDKTGVVQLVLEDKDMIEKLKNEMSLEVKGEVIKNDKAFSGIEIKVGEIKIVGKTYYDTLPFEINKRKLNTSLENQLDYRYISLRRPKILSIFKIQEEICNSFRTFFSKKGFIEIHTPKILSAGSEGGAEVFTVNYFDRRAFLAQSPQFYKQMMVGTGFEAVFEIGHAYRAELHNTWRHLNEYVSMDIELGFIENEEELIDIEESFLKYLFENLLDKYSEHLKKHKVELKKIDKIPRITFSDVREIMLKEYDKKTSYNGLDSESEKLISEYVKEKYDSDFVFITKYPVKKRPVYTMPDEDNEGFTKSFDLIYKGLEITTGGQRIHDYKMFKENIEKFKVNPEGLEDYIESFKYGMPPHGGFAIGLERLTMKILELDNIRKASLFPRDIGRIRP